MIKQFAIGPIAERNLNLFYLITADELRIA